MSTTPTEAIAKTPDRKTIAVDQNSAKQERVVYYEVFGMDSSGCQSVLEKQVNKIDGVAGSKAIFKAKFVVIVIF